MDHHPAAVVFVLLDQAECVINDERSNGRLQVACMMTAVWRQPTRITSADPAAAAGVASIVIGACYAPLPTMQVHVVLRVR